VKRFGTIDALRKCTFQGGAKCGAAIWGERDPAIELSFGFVIF
jgi:hypothetical protein